MLLVNYDYQHVQVGGRWGILITEDLSHPTFPHIHAVKSWFDARFASFYNLSRKEGDELVRTLVNYVPDLLTLLRVVIAVIFLGAGMAGWASLGRDIWLLVAAWTSDMVDGRLSRLLRLDHSTWLSKNDVYVDMFVSAAILFYMTVSGMLALWLVLTYLLVWSVVFLRYGISPLFSQAFQNPIYALFVFFTVQAEPWVLPWLLLWAVVMLAFFWQRAVELFNNTVRKLRG